MRKLFFTISLISMVMTPFMAMALQLPEEILNKNPDLKKYQLVILEEGFGPHSGLPKGDEKRPLFRVTRCEYDVAQWDEKKKTGPILCNTLEYLEIDKCDESDDLVITNSSGKKEANPTGERVICDEVGVIVGKGGLELLKNFITTIYVWGASLVGLIAVLRIVIAGVEISVSQGAGNLEEAKNKIFQCIASLILIFLSAMILYTINPNFFT